MPRYGYTCVDTAGEKRADMMYGMNADHVRRTLQADGMSDISIVLGKYPGSREASSCVIPRGRESKSKGQKVMPRMFYTLSEASKVLNVSEQEVMDMGARNEIQQFRDGTRLMYKRDQVNAKAPLRVPEVSMEPESCWESGIMDAISDVPTPPTPAAPSRSTSSARSRRRHSKKSKGSLGWKLCFLSFMVFVFGGVFYLMFHPQIQQWMATTPDEIAVDTATSYEGMSQEAEAQLGEVNAKLQAITPAIERLLDDKESLKQKLSELEVSSSEDLRDNQRAQIIAREFAEVVFYVERLEQKKQSYQDALFELEAIKRRIERQAYAIDAGLTENEMGKIDVALRTIRSRVEEAGNVDEQLHQIDMDQLVDQYMR